MEKIRWSFARVLRVVEVVAEVLVEEDRHQVGRRHGGGRVARVRDGARADGVDAELLSQLAPALVIGHAGNVAIGARRRRFRSPRGQARSRRSRGAIGDARARRARSRHGQPGAADRLSGQGPRSRGGPARGRCGARRARLRLRGGGLGGGEQARRHPCGGLPRRLLGAPGRRARRHERPLPGLRGRRRRARGRARPRLSAGTIRRRASVMYGGCKRSKTWKD